MKVRNLLGLVAAVTLCGTASAGEVGAVTSFSAGTAAQAAEVNANFQALIAAIDDNATRIAALETLDNSVSGHSYSLHFAGTFLAAEVDTDDGSRDFADIEHYVGEATLNFSADNTGTGDSHDVAGANVSVSGGGGIGFNGDGAEPLESLTFTWSQTGNVVTVNIDGEGEALTLFASEDGSLLAGRGIEQGIDNRDDGSSADSSDISTIILIRQP